MFEKVRDIIAETLSCDLEQVTMEASLADESGGGFSGRGGAEYGAGGGHRRLYS